MEGQTLTSQVGVCVSIYLPLTNKVGGSKDFYQNTTMFKKKPTVCLPPPNPHA